MIINYIKVAWRNILRFKGHSLINITGLAISLMFCILAVIFVRYESSFDKFHDNADRIHLLYHQAGSSDRKPSGATPPILAPTIAESIPGIERTVRVYGWDLKDGTPVRFQDRTLMMRGFHVDPDFLGLFSFPRISGERETALNDPSSMVITRSMAESLFGDQDPLGREVRIQLRNGEKSFFVKSVIRLPKSSSKGRSIGVPIISTPMFCLKKALPARLWNHDYWLFLRIISKTGPGPAALISGPPKGRSNSCPCRICISTRKSGNG